MTSKKKRKTIPWLFGLVLLLGFILPIGLVLLNNWRGAKALEEMVVYMESEGESLDIRDLLPSALEGDEWFVKHPLIDSQLHYSDSPNGPVFVDPENQKRLNSWSALATTIDVQVLPSAWAGLATNWSELGEFLQANHDIEGENVSGLVALKQFLAATELDFESLLTAAEQPAGHVGQPWDFRQPLNTSLQYSRVFMDVAKVARLQGLVALKEGNGEKAFRCFRLGSRVIQLLQSDPMVISQLVAMANQQLMLTLVWEGLRENRWSATEMELIDQELATWQPIEGMIHGLRGEQCIWMVTLDSLKGASPLEIQQAIGPSAGGLSGLLSLMGKAHGWISFNQVNGIQGSYDHLIKPLKKRDFDGVTLESYLKTAAEEHRWSPHWIFVFLALGTYENFADRVLPIEAGILLGRGAIALEIHRKQHGSYPPNLEVLGDAMPNDPVTNAPFEYQLTGDRYTLYSLGLNRTDEGGLRVMKNNGNRPKIGEGDWVWSYEPEKE